MENTNHVVSKAPSQTLQSFTIQFIKGIPYFVDAENKAYLFSKSPLLLNKEETSRFTPFIGVVSEDGKTIQLTPDWKRNADESLQHYRRSLTPFERKEHTKVVKCAKKSPTKSAKVTIQSTTTETATEPVIKKSPVKKRSSKVPNGTGTNS